MSVTIGIDLGTTNSVVAELRDGRPRPIDVDGSPIVPSVVFYEEDGGVLVGRRARNLALTSPQRVVRSVKRRMGREKTLTVAGREVAPEEVSAEILRTLKAAAEAELGTTIEQAVITVPAYFDDAQRRATLEAGRQAGLSVSRLVNEPTAASLVYEPVLDGDGDGPPQLVLVYDLGGGTFDVSVLEVMGGVREVRASSGNSALGGDDFDAKLIARFVDAVRTDSHHDVSCDPVAMARLQRAAEQAKIELSSEVETRVCEEFLTEIDGVPINLDVVVTRREFEAMIQPLVDSTMDLCLVALDEAKLRSDEPITRICLVGGSTRIPLVRERVAAAFEADIHQEIDADLAVALGAAVQGGILDGVAVDRVLVDVAAHSLGLRTIGQDDAWGEADCFTPIICRNTALPCERTEELYTATHDQEKVCVEVYQGEAPRATHNTLVGEFDFSLQPAPCGSPVRFRFAYDLDGVIRVTASQPGGPDKTVDLRVADASEPSTPQATAKKRRTRGHDSAVPVEAEPPAQGAIARRAQALLSSLSPDEGEGLRLRLLAYTSAGTPEARAQAEDALLDLFLEYEAGGGRG